MGSSKKIERPMRGSTHDTLYDRQVASRKVMGVYFEDRMSKAKHCGQNVVCFVHKPDGTHTNH
jgi:hypothetical protein